MVIFKNILNAEVYYFSMGANCKDFVSKLLVRNPRKRLGCLKGGAEDVKAHRWYRGMDWGQLREKQVAAPWVPPLEAGNPLDTQMFADIEEEPVIRYTEGDCPWMDDFCPL